MLRHCLKSLAAQKCLGLGLQVYGLGRRTHTADSQYCAAPMLMDIVRESIKTGVSFPPTLTHHGYLQNFFLGSSIRARNCLRGAAGACGVGLTSQCLTQYGCTGSRVSSVSDHSCRGWERPKQVGGEFRVWGLGCGCQSNLYGSVDCKARLKLTPHTNKFSMRNPRPIHHEGVGTCLNPR